jgi:hypothetical protein
MKKVEIDRLYMDKFVDLRSTQIKSILKGKPYGCDHTYGQIFRQVISGDNTNVKYLDNIAVEISVSGKEGVMPFTYWDLKSLETDRSRANRKKPKLFKSQFKGEEDYFLVTYEWDPKLSADQT